MIETAVVASAASSAAIASAASPGLFVATIGFITGLLLSWPAMIIVLVFGILCEHNGSHGWAVFASLVSMAVAYFLFSVSLFHLALGAIAYIGIGLVWSWHRYKRHANDIVEKHIYATDIAKSHALEQLHPKAMLPTITAWIVIWPFSFIEHFIGDIINGIQLLVSKVFRGIYHKIYDSAVAALITK